MLNRIFIILTLVLISVQCWAHVPYLEKDDFSVKRPFKVQDSIEQSLAIYAWLEDDNSGISKDIDVFVFQINEPTNVYLEVLVPVCEGYENFFPWFALAGPGLSESRAPLPFDIPPGYGIEVVPNGSSNEQRERFYEIFGGKSYYKGPVFDKILTVPGTYHVYFWNPQHQSGDYVAVMGKKEIWRFRDIFRALRNTPLIRLGMELHTDCPDLQLENRRERGPLTH